MKDRQKDIQTARIKAQSDRGRPPKIAASDVYGTAENNRSNFDEVWDRLWPLLSNARSETEVTKAFEEGARPYHRNFAPALSALTLQVLQEPTLPKRPRSLKRFLADSLAARGIVTPRRSREICAKQRAARKQTHRIVRYELFVECSCGYKGHSENLACPKCGAEISFPLGFGSLIL